VAIVNRSLARHYFGDQNPLGKRIELVEGGCSGVFCLELDGAIPLLF
jgi:hypothetical protein